MEKNLTTEPILEMALELNNLSTLDLRINQLTQIKADAFNCLTNLQILNLSGNQLTEIKVETFNQLRKLEKLDLSNNRWLN